MSKKEKSIGFLLSNWKAKKNKPVTFDIPIIDRSKVKSLSPGQRRLWFLQQLFPGNPFYNYSELYTFIGNFDKNCFKKSLDLLVAKHEILRTTYPIVNGEPTIEISEEAKLELKEYDFSNLNQKKAEFEANRIIQIEKNKAIAISKGEIYQSLIIKIATGVHYFFINIHHIAMDEWSMGIFRNELAKYYNILANGGNLVQPKLGVQYLDYAHWKNQEVTNERQLAYWKNKLNGEINRLNLQTDLKRPLSPSFKGKHITETYSAEFSNAILTAAKKMEVTPFSFLFSIFNILLYKHTGQKDIIVGTPISNREKRSLEDTIGFFNDTVVLRSKFNSTDSFELMVKNTSKTVMEAFANKDVSFETLVQELNPDRSLSVNPFFQVMFLYNDAPKKPFFNDGLEFQYEVLGADASKFDLTLFVTNTKGVISIRLEYATDLFVEKTISRLKEHFKLLTQYLISNKSALLENVPMYTKEEEKLFFKKEENVTSSFDVYNGIHEIISSFATKTPNAKAVSFLEEVIDYNRLEEESLVVAQHILQKTKGSKEIIGLCIDRSISMIVGLVGILKAGCAYLPIDSEYPRERIDYMITDANVPFILTNSSLRENFKASNVPLVILDEIPKESSYLTLPNVSREDIAYVIYTSGSTGNPKGVPISHGNIIRSTEGRFNFYNNAPTAFLLMSSVSFDSSKAGIFWTLCGGGNLIITEKRIEQDLDKIEKLISHEGVSHILMLPSLYKAILENAAPLKLNSLTTVIVAGEACSIALCKLHFIKMKNTLLYNEYGPTEATVWCVAHQIKEEDLNKQSVPIGKVVAGATAYILDENMNFVPYGSAGRLFIGGPNLSKGYLNKDELTKRVFVPAKWLKEKKIIYNTGDLARYDLDGNLQFLGRSDSQLKIRGFRIEISEIEKAILQVKTVEKTVVIAETADKVSLDNIDENISQDQLLNILKAYLNEAEIEALIDSVTSLNNSEKQYLLEKI